MPKHPYASAVLKGALSRGWSKEKLASAMKVRPTHLKQLLAGERDLTDRQVEQIEQATGLTGGQLAVSILEPKGGPTTELMNEWAKAVPIAKSRRTSARPKRSRVIS